MPFHYILLGGTGLTPKLRTQDLECSKLAKELQDLSTSSERVPITIDLHQCDVVVSIMRDIVYCWV